MGEGIEDCEECGSYFPCEHDSLTEKEEHEKAGHSVIACYGAGSPVVVGFYCEDCDKEVEWKT